MPRRLHLTRSHAVLRVKWRLEQDSFRRLQMGLIVGLTGGAGLLSAHSPHWLESAVRRTALPFVLTGVFVSITGAAMAAYAPGAHSIGQVMQHAQTQR